MESKKISKKSKFYFDDLKSTFILKKIIFDYIKKPKSLKIMKYNKKIQKRLNLSFNYYKDYSTLYSPIEIELMLVNDNYDKFINISDKEKEYYHIYFDNSNEEIKRKK